MQKFEFDASKVKVKRAVTVPILKMEDGKDYYVKIIAAPRAGKMIEGREGKEPPTVCPILDLTTGTQAEFIMGDICKNELAEQYGALENTVGKCFAFRKRAIDGKKYKAWDIAEIDDPTAGAETPEEQASAAKSLKAKR